MVLVNKECSICKYKEQVWIPKDMVNQSFECPFCLKGIVSYIVFDFTNSK